VISGKISDPTALHVSVNTSELVKFVDFKLIPALAPEPPFR
jgi:hypothetical protein